MRNILITGGAGYVGSAFLPALLKKYPDANVTVIDNLLKGRVRSIFSSIKEFRGRFHFKRMDVRNYEQVSKLFKENSFDTVFSFAAIVDGVRLRRMFDGECIEVDYEAVNHLVNEAKNSGVKNFIHHSSCSIYTPNSNLKEDSVKEPLTTYGMAKLLGEKSVLKMNDRNFKVVVLRPGTIFGYSPGFRGETVINTFAECAYYGESLRVFKQALDNKKSYLGINDCVRALLFTLENIDKLYGESYNIVSFSVTLREVLSVLEGVFGELKLNIVDDSAQKHSVFDVNGDKFRSKGFEFRSNLKDELSILKQYFEQDNFSRNFE